MQSENDKTASAAPARGWDDRYRSLGEGEIIQAGDEVLTDSHRGWQPAKHAIGQPAPNPNYMAHRMYCRLKASAAPAVTDWKRVAKLAGAHGIRYRTNAALEAFLSELSSSSPADAQAVAGGLYGDYTPITVASSTAAPSSELEELRREVERCHARLEIDPGGSDKIDELESAAGHLRHRAEALEERLKLAEAALEAADAMVAFERDYTTMPAGDFYAKHPDYEPDSAARVRSELRAAFVEASIRARTALSSIKENGSNG